MLTPKIGKSRRESGFENPDVIIETVHLSICLVFCLLALFSILLMNFLGWEVELVVLGVKATDSSRFISSLLVRASLSHIYI